MEVDDSEKDRESIKERRRKLRMDDAHIYGESDNSDAEIANKENVP